MEKKQVLMHQLIAAANGRETEAKVITTETEHIFNSRSESGPFTGSEVNQTTNIEGGTVAERKANFPTTSVEERVAYHIDKITDFFDTAINREDANGMGLVRSELVIDDKSYGVHSANAYMCLRKQLIGLSRILAAAPSFEEGAYDWEPDPDRKYTFKRVESKARFKPSDRVIRVEGYPPDDVKAPVQKVTMELHYGDIVTTTFCSKWTSTRKAQILTRLGELIKAVDAALYEANACDVSDVVRNKLATDLLKSLLK